jgi:hypothetical protein
VLDNNIFCARELDVTFALWLLLGDEEPSSA